MNSSRAISDPTGRAARAGGEIALYCYRFAGGMCEPFAPHLLRRRELRGKADAARRGERLGHAGLARPHGPVVWLHAASVGETMAILPLADRLSREGFAVVFTTGTLTSAAIAAARLPGGARHQFAPVDLPGPVGRFLDHWRPALAIFAESELWPATLAALADRNIPLALVNARMSARSFAGWMRLMPLCRALFRRVTTALAQTDLDAERLGALGARSVRVTGNLKFDAPPPPVDAGELGLWREVLNARPVFLAASTHDGEDRTALDVHRAVVGARPDVLTIIAPRHPERGEALGARTAELDLNTAKRSRGDVPTADTAVVIADTIGDMGLWYRLADATFVGGSLVAHGGQNPIEPAKLGVPVLHGPHVNNFAEVYGALDRAGGAFQVDDAGRLAEAFRHLTGSADRRLAAGAAAERCVAGFAGALDRTMEALRPHLDEAHGAGHAAAARA